MSQTSYSPEEHGARCHECPLRARRLAGKFVPPELKPGASLLVIAEAPGKNEEAVRLPLVGASGNEFSRALIAAGSRRDEVSLTNALLCRPDRGQKLTDYLSLLRRKNKARAVRDEPPIPSPLVCCRERLMEEVFAARGLLLMGVTARSAVFPEASEKALMKHRGFPDVIKLSRVDPSGMPVAEIALPALATLHPAFVLRYRRWTDVFRGDVAKAIRMARGGLTWQEPRYVFFPTPEQLANVLAALGPAPSFDVETTRDSNVSEDFDSLYDLLRCIGIGDDKLVTCVPVRSCEAERGRLGMSAWYKPAEQEQVMNILRAWFGDESGRVVAHNSQYDLTVMERFIPVKRQVFDTVIAHHVVWSELPHDLGFCSSQYTDARQHKDVDHDMWERDYDLHLYCMADVAVTSRLALSIATDDRLIGQRRAFEADMRLSSFCRNMHKVGIRLDVAEQSRHFANLTERMDRTLVLVHAHGLAGLPSNVSEAERATVMALNPGSSAHVRYYLFDLCNVAPVPAEAGGYTDSGDPSVSRDNLFSLIDRGLPREVEEFVHSVIDYREALKLRGTYCKMKPGPDGRIHATWNPHVVVSGRLSTSNPNLLNVKGPLRSMFIAEEGHELVFLDKKQLELRVIAWLAQDTELIEAFLTGADIHVVNTAAILGIGQDEVTKAKRKFGKTFTYAVQYGAAPAKAHQMVRNFRDTDGKRPYSNFTLLEAETLYKRWWKSRAAIKKYHEKNEDLFDTVGYLAEPLHGRRRYFLDGKDEMREAMYNFIIQSASAADVNDAIERVLVEFPWGFAGPCTGIVHYNYDSVGIEVPAGMAISVGRRAAQLMDSKIGGMPLPVDINVGPSWYDLTEVK